MRRLLIRNPSLDNVEKTFLSSAYTAGGTSLTVLNNFAFAANNILVVGKPGEEKSESKKLDSVSGNTTLTLASTLKFDHQQNTPIYESQWDQVEISKQQSGGAWSVISTSGLQWDKSFTVYEDSTGDSTYSYRWRFYNSVSGFYSEYSPTYTGAGFNRDQVGYMIREIRKITNTLENEDVVSDKEIVRLLNSAQDIIYGIRKDWWFLKFEDNDITTQASVLQYNLDLLGGGVAGTPASNFVLGFVDKVRYRFSDGVTDTTYPLKFKTESEFDMLIQNELRQTDDWVNNYTLKPGDSSSINGYLWAYPTPKTTGYGTFYVRAFRKFLTLDDDIDTTPVPIPGILENYVIAFIHRVRGNDAKADYYEELFFGPPPEKESSRRLTGIPLLEQLNKKNTPVSNPNRLSRFRGQKSVSNQDNSRYPRNNRDYIKENYW